MASRSASSGWRFSTTSNSTPTLRDRSAKRRNSAYLEQYHSPRNCKSLYPPHDAMVVNLASAGGGVLGQYSGTTGGRIGCQLRPQSGIGEAGVPMFMPRV